MKKENKKKKNISETEKVSTKEESAKEHNVIWDLFHRINPYLNRYIGKGYVYLHSIIFLLGVIILIFSNNLFYILILFNITFIDSISIIILHDCPLNYLEEKYLNVSMITQKNDFYKKAGLLFNCNHNYERQLEILILIASLCIFKLFMIIIMRSMNISFT